LCNSWRVGRSVPSISTCCNVLSGNYQQFGAVQTLASQRLAHVRRSEEKEQWQEYMLKACISRSA